MAATTEDLNRRVSELETQITKLLDSTQDLVISTTILTQNVNQLTELMKEMKELNGRLRQLELDVNNNKLISKLVVWLAATVGGSAIVMFFAYLSSLGS